MSGKFQPFGRIGLFAQADAFSLNPTTDVWEIPTLYGHTFCPAVLYFRLNPTTDVWEIPTIFFLTDNMQRMRESQSHH